MGSRYLWCRLGVSLLRPNRSLEYRTATGSTARCNPAGSSEATTRAHEWLQRDHPEADGPNGLVIVANIYLSTCCYLFSRLVLVDGRPTRRCPETRLLGTFSPWCCRDDVRPACETQ